MKPPGIPILARCTGVCAVLLSMMLAAGCDRRLDKDDELDKPAGSDTEAEESKETVTLSPLAAGEIQIIEISTGSGLIRRKFSGQIEFNRNKTVEVTSPMEGRLLEWLVEPGEMVKAGDVLARVENPQNLGQPIEIKSQISGEVVLRQGALGGAVATSEPQFVVSDLDVVWAVAEVREDMAGKIMKEIPAEVRVLAYPDEVFTGRIFNESASVQRESRTIDFFLEVPNTDHKLRDGMFAYVALATGRVENTLLVPEEALQRVHGDSVVFVRQEEPGEYKLTRVRLGRKLGDSYEVLEGIEPGSKVASRGSFLLKSEYLKSELAEDND
jgi:multidrug efflux pump subunit AcrA (membrane-fusion protein)